jgi:hypothetical protein
MGRVTHYFHISLEIQPRFQGNTSSGITYLLFSFKILKKYREGPAETTGFM